MGVKSFVELGGSVRVFVSGLPGMIVGDVGDVGWSVKDRGRKGGCGSV